MNPVRNLKNIRDNNMIKYQKISNGVDRKQTGKLGEDIAVKHLKKKKYKILARNWQNKWGEIDIVAKHKRKIIFVEVKTLRLAPLAQGRPSYFSPFDEINEKKKRQLVKMAQIYLLQNKISLETPHQIDVIAVELTDGKPNIRHLENTLEDII